MTESFILLGNLSSMVAGMCSSFFLFHFACFNFSVQCLHFQNPGVRIIHVWLHLTLLKLGCCFHKVFNLLSFSAWNNSWFDSWDSLIAKASPLHDMIKNACGHHLVASTLSLSSFSNLLCWLIIAALSFLWLLYWILFWSSCVGFSIPLMYSYTVVLNHPFNQ